MWKIILSLFTGPLSSLSDDLKEAYQSKLNAANDKERIAAEERISTLEARRNVILAAQSDPYERWIRILWAFPFVAYTIKTVFWDKVLGLGVTDNLSEDLWLMLYIILGGYFIDSAIKRIKK